MTFRGALAVMIVMSWPVWLPATGAHATVALHPLFADHAVLQQGAKVAVWGTADPGEAVTVEMAGQTVSTQAGADRKWLVRLSPMKAGGPYTLSVSGTVGQGQNRIVRDDILIGEVWLASGQSNMERQLGPRVGQPLIDNWEREAAAAKFPRIRHFAVAQEKSLVRLDSIKGHWEVCTPAAVKDFTAVGYFFARDLHRARHVPVGIIHSSWGGTPAEAWTSEAGLQPLPDFSDVSTQLQTLIRDPAAARRAYEAKLEAWFAASDAGSRGKQFWSDPALPTDGEAKAEVKVEVKSEAWKTMTLPTVWEEAGEPDLNGVVWFRKSFDLPAGAAGAAATLQLGMIDDIDTTWVNGAKLGTTLGWDVVRKYAVPAGILKPGRNVVAVRVLDTGGGGGIWGDKKIELRFEGRAAVASVDLAGPWRYRIGLDLTKGLRDGAWPPTGFTGDVDTPTILYNAMIAPLVPYTLAGVIWYQGEANVRREQQYRALLPALIGDWRKAWAPEAPDRPEGADAFPFLFVQIAPHHDMTPELRDAQLWAWRHTQKTAMVVTTDCGDAKDIHPARKQPVGARLALAARALAYGERLEYSGPVLDAMKVESGKAELRFTHLGGGLVARRVPVPVPGSAAKSRGSGLVGFTLAGSDGVFHQARAVIRGKTVVVSSDEVAQPTAVRYGWANVPTCNLFNKAGLPASPFRTDDR